MEIRFTKAARRHRIGRRSARYVMASTDPSPIITAEGNPAWFYLARTSEVVNWRSSPWR